MLDLKRLNENDKTTVYEVESFSSITVSLIRDLKKINVNKESLVFRPKKRSISCISSLRETFEKKSYVEFGFYAKKDAIILPKIGSIDDNTISSIESIYSTKYIDLVLNNIKENYYQEWLPFIGREIANTIEKTIIKKAKSSRILLLYKGEKIESNLKGMVFLFPNEDCLNNPLTQVGWIWFHHAMDSNSRKIAHHKILSFLRENGLRNFQAGIHLHNVRSQLFHLKYGFKPLCCHVATKSF